MTFSSRILSLNVARARDRRDMTVPSGMSIMSATS
jgi:hypothetical protein